MKYYELIPLKQFEEIYDISINNQFPKKNKRRLENEISGYKEEENVFEINDIGFCTFGYNLIIDSSLKTNSMKAKGIIKYNEKEKEEIVSNDQVSNLSSILSEFEISSNAGNHLANILYNNIKFDMEELIEMIKYKISSVNRNISYSNITKIFDTSYDLFNLYKLPKEIVDESNYIYEKIKLLFTELNSFNSKEKFDVIRKNIYNFILKSHELLYNLSNNLKNLGIL